MSCERRKEGSNNSQETPNPLNNSNLTRAFSTTPNLESTAASLWNDYTVVEYNRDILSSHIWNVVHEIGETSNICSTISVKRIPHRLLIGVESISNSTESSSIITCADKILIHSVIFIVRHHHEELRAKAIRCSLRQQHVCGPENENHDASRI